MSPLPQFVRAAANLVERNSFRYLILALFVFLSTNGHAQLPAIELTGLSRSAGTIGSEFELQLLAGTRLDEVESLRFSDPAVTAELLTKPPLPRTDAPQPDYGRFRVKVPADLSPGRIEVRAVGRHGVSNPRILRLTEYPCTVVEPTSHDRANPAELPRDHLLLARCTPAEIDYFAVSVDKGESLRIRVAAQSIDSRMIGQLTLLDDRGNIVRSSRGADGVDPEVVLSGDVSGEYTLAVHDFLYRGGNEYPYQLTLERLAETVDAAEPSPDDGRQSVEELWRSAADRSTSRLPAQTQPFAFSLARFDSSAVTHWLPSTPDDESNPLTVQPPARIAGRFDARRGVAGEQRTIRFDAEQGQSLALEVYSQRLGQPTDIRLVIERLDLTAPDNPQWHQLQLEDDSQPVGDAAFSLRTTDPAVLFQVPETGTYRATVRDLDTGDALGPHQYFVLEIRQPEPGFDLLVYPPIAHSDLNQSKPTGANLVRGGAESIRVFTVRRDGWTGPIELTLDGLPEGSSCSPVSIPADQTQATLNLVAGPEAGPWVGAVRLLGRAKVADQDCTVEAVAGTVQWAKSSTRPFVRSRLTTDLALAVSDQDVSPVSVQWGGGEIPEAAPGGTLSIPVKLTRQDNGKGACILRPQNLPPGVTAAEVTIPADQSEGAVEIKIAENVAPATFTPWLQVETPVQWQPNPQQLERAQQYLASLQEQLAAADSDEARAEIEAGIKVAQERVEAAKPSANPQNITLFLSSNNTTFRVVSK